MVPKFSIQCRKAAGSVHLGAGVTVTVKFLNKEVGLEIGSGIKFIIR